MPSPHSGLGERKCMLRYYKVEGRSAYTFWVNDRPPAIYCCVASRVDMPEVLCAAPECWEGRLMQSRMKECKTGMILVEIMFL